MSTFIRKLLLKINDKEEKLSLIQLLNRKQHLDCKSIIFLEKFKTQETPDIQALIENILKSLKLKLLNH